MYTTKIVELHRKKYLLLYILRLILLENDRNEDAFLYSLSPPNSPLHGLHGRHNRDPGQLPRLGSEPQGICIC